MYPDFSINFFVDEVGAIEKSIGAISASAKYFILANGFIPLAFATYPSIRTKNDKLNKISQVPIEQAPSLILLAFAGVTVPSFIKADFKVGNFSGANF